MPAATAVSKTTENRISAEARTKIKQERAKLQQEFEHCQENFDIAAAALEAAADPALDSQVYVDAHRDYMQMEIKLKKKQAELAKHRKTFLSDEEIAARDKEDADAKEVAFEERNRQSFIANRRRALPLITELLKIDDEVKDLPCRFNESTGWLKDSFGAVSALKKSLVKRAPRVNLHGGVESIATTEPCDVEILAELARVLDGLTALDMHANPHWWFR